MLASTSWGASNKRSLRKVYLQPVAACPTPDVVDALRHPGLKQVDISRSTPSVALHLRVIRIQMRMEATVVDQ